MSTSIDQAFVKQFEREVHEAYQRQGSKLRADGARQERRRRQLDRVPEGRQGPPRRPRAATPWCR